MVYYSSVEENGTMVILEQTDVNETESMMGEQARIMAMNIKSHTDAQFIKAYSKRYVWSKYSKCVYEERVDLGLKNIPDCPKMM